MFGCISLLCVAGVLAGNPPEAACGSYLYEPSYCMDKLLHGNTKAYVPQPGDVMLATDKNFFWKITHDLAFAFEPHNSAIVVARCDGSLAILEAGPNDTLRIRMLDLLPHLAEYADKGPVWIRKRKCPLTPEQSACLTDFAHRQDGKRFAIGRLGVQLTPFRDRGLFRTEFMGKPNLNRRSYFCSELVTNAGVAGGIMNAETTRPSATYPHDLFFDHSHNPYINQHLPLVHDWEPPARWVYQPAICP